MLVQFLRVYKMSIHGVKMERVIYAIISFQFRFSQVLKFNIHGPLALYFKASHKKMNGPFIYTTRIYTAPCGNIKKKCEFSVNLYPTHTLTATTIVPLKV